MLCYCISIQLLLVDLVIEIKLLVYILTVCSYVILSKENQKQITKQFSMPMLMLLYKLYIQLHSCDIWQSKSI